MRKLLRALVVSFALLGVALLAFNVWYFLVRMGVGPSFYLERHVTGRAERLAEEPLYIAERDDYARLNELYEGPPAVLFVGDSQTRRFRVHERFPKLAAVNRGLGSDTTVGLLARWDTTVAPLPTRMLLLQIGYNDHEFRSVDEAIENTRTLIEKAKAQASRVLVQSLLPVRDRAADANEKIREHNEKLEGLVRKLDVEWLDLHPHFVAEDGALDMRFSDDGAHPNAAGYDKWTELLQGHLEAEAVLGTSNTIP